MFIQVIEGRVGDRDALRAALETWHREVAPGAEGWVGSTAGVTADGRFITLVRFESAAAAQRNSDRPEQHTWWTETAKLFAGDVAFHDSSEVGVFRGGGSDDAGFVQVMQARVSDPTRLDQLVRQYEDLAREHRPEVIGWTTALHRDGTFTMAVYFTSEAAAREGERAEPPDELKPIMEEQQRLLSDLRYYDLTEPMLYSPGR